MLGLWEENGSVRFSEKLLPVSEVVIQQLTFSDLRERLRLTGPCIQSRCVYWKGHCSLGEHLSRLSVEVVAPTCAISEQCRWRSENGNSACGVCTKVMRGFSIVDLQLGEIDA